MEKLTKKQMIERLAKFRVACDQINDDLNNLSNSVLSTYQLISAKEDKTEEEEEVCRQLKQLINLVIKSTLSSDNYNKSMRQDYTQVVKTLGASSDANSYGD